jgi:hypothetical protein
MTKAEQEKTGLTGGDKEQGDLHNTPDNELPEGLQRERKGPYDKHVGRNEETSQVPSCVSGPESGEERDRRALMSEENRPEKRPGPFAQDRSRTPPTKKQRHRDYQPEKNETGAAIKGKDDLAFPKNDESKWG